jgi:hypothetical protein
VQKHDKVEKYGAKGRLRGKKLQQYSRTDCGQIDSKRYTMSPSVRYLPKVCIIKQKNCVWAAPINIVAGHHL